MCKSMMVLMASVSILIAGSKAEAQTPHVVYEPVNLVASENGHTLTGDIIIRRHDGQVEFADFLARSNGQFMSSGSLNYPITDASMIVVNVGGGGTGPGDGQHVQVVGRSGEPGTQWAPLVVGATCASMYALLRMWCSMDCSPHGVSNWSAGYCGAGATCVCNLPPPPLPAIGRPVGPLGMGSPFLVPFGWTSFWLRP